MKKKVLIKCLALLVLGVVLIVLGHTQKSKQEALISEYEDRIREYESVIAEKESMYLELTNKWMTAEHTRWISEMNYTYLADEYKEFRKGFFIEMPVYEYDKDEVLLLAKIAQLEAGVPSKSPTAFRYVVSVILNRVSSPEFPDTITEVLYQKVGNNPQFSAVYNDRLMENEVDEESIRVTYEVLLFGSGLPTYVEYFYESSVKGNWVNTLPIYMSADGTTFAYSERSVR